VSNSSIAFCPVVREGIRGLERKSILEYSVRQFVFFEVLEVESESSEVSE